MKWHWLSFADSALPKGTQFLGAVLVKAPDFITAVMQTHALGLNPGGEVQGIEGDNLSDEMLEPWANRLLTRTECEAFDRAVAN